MSDADNHSGTSRDGKSSPEGTGLVPDLVMALRFFSRLPSGRQPHAVPNLDRIARILPLASILIGLGPAGVLLLGIAGGIPPLFAAIAAAACSAIVTGAMSEDAAADAADGLFGGNTAERRLKILKDSRHGTYGVLTIVFLVGLKASALAALTVNGGLAAAMLWLAAGLVARSGGLYIAMALPPARTVGASATAGRLSRNAFGFGLVFALVIAVILAVPFVSPLGVMAALAIGAAVAFGWTRLCDRLVGGQTGDLIGALQALLEIALLATFMTIIAG
ncbi:adenosylcobinamide-GDP ribazoletransferase [Pelagibacterium halotolerans]|nr:adenosylcobinamide-GDP ribazoletransferase [Pelagibacterium halotolerans]QJR19190.1 adenosylcobinamide-GDP ribazoletransferase [Pelagibacterium halotolerans]SDZ99618.1 cobalamin-5'-phosphate synthase [Pelagibacterium halotolerans]